MRRNRGAEVQLHTFVISALVRFELSASRPGRFIPGKETLISAG